MPVLDPFDGRTEMTSEEYRAWIDGHALVAAQDGPGREESTETRAKTLLGDYLERGGFGRVVREAMVCPKRRFRADWYLPDQTPPVVIEYDGVMSGQASHASIAGILRDAEKGNLAQAAGMRFYRLNARTVHDGTGFTFLDSVLRRLDE